MPTYRSITISLISQFDILTIPEYAPPAPPNDPFSNAPTLINPDHSLVSVYIPTYPSSQFWLSYSISPPHPPKLLYYFKLYLNGHSIVSWGCGEDDAYRGKTMFGLFKPARTSGLAKCATSERRVLCFGPDIAGLDHPSLDNLSDVMEIRVFRSKARKRISPEVQTLSSAGIPPNLDRRKSPQQRAIGGINLVNAGTVLDRHPQRYYKHALLDPLDTPFATFRYYYRTWDQLEALGVVSPDPSESTSVTSIESSVVRSQQNIATTAEQPLSPQGSSNTLESYQSMSASSGSAATNAALQLAEDSKDNTTVEATTTTTDTNKPSPPNSHPCKNTTEATPPNDPDDDLSSQSTTTSPTASPLKIPFFLPRPPTPPSQPPSPNKHPQLPPTIPPTLHDLTTLASKESFASLIRNRLPDPDPSSFRLHNPAEVDPSSQTNLPATPPTLASPNSHKDRAGGSFGKRTGTGSMGVLMGVVNSATNRRRREASAAAAAAARVVADSSATSEEEHTSEGERTEGESVSIGSGSEGSGKDSGKSDAITGKEKTKKKKEKQRLKREKTAKDRKDETDKQPRPEEQRKRRERKLNLWEEL